MNRFVYGHGTSRGICRHDFNVLNDLRNLRLFELSGSDPAWKPTREGECDWRYE
jgi:hypothetical protein